MLCRSSPDSLTLAGTQITLNPTASKVAQALLVCSGDVTSATVFECRGLAIDHICKASVRLVSMESTKITAPGGNAIVATRVRSAESDTIWPPTTTCSLETIIVCATP